MRTRTNVPLESDEQKALLRWAEMSKGKYKGVEQIFHIANGGSRNVIEAKNLKAQGVKRGVPDLFLPVAIGKYHGMFIEMKRTQGGRLSEDQQYWISRLTENGYYCVVCKGWLEAVRCIQNYYKQGDSET